MLLSKLYFESLIEHYIPIVANVRMTVDVRMMVDVLLA